MAGGRRSHGQGTFWGDLIGPNPTDRGKAGTKRSLLVDGEGGPLSIVVAGANVHEAIVVERPQPTEEEPQHLCLDKGYDNPSGRGAAAGHGYREHIRRIGEEKLDASGDKRYPARRWIVERTLAWLSKCRAVLVRYDKKAANYLGVLQLADPRQGPGPLVTPGSPRGLSPLSLFEGGRDISRLYATSTSLRQGSPGRSRAKWAGSDSRPFDTGVRHA